MAVQNPVVREPVVNELPIPPAVQREIDLLRAQVDFPLADRDILYLVNGDAAAIRGAAEKLHNERFQLQALQATQPPAPPAPVPPSPAPAPVVAPVPVPGPGIVQPPEHQEEAHYQELRSKVELRIANELERQEFFTLALRGGWNQHVATLSARPGRS